jgi:hypothetical protein
MTTLLLDLPEAIARRLRERNVTEQEVKAIAVAALEVWLEQAGSSQAGASHEFGESAIPFVRRLIAQNRTLFETLAQR